MWTMPELPTPNSRVERIAFYGPMCSGKTYLANFLVEEFRYRKYSFAAKLKSICYELYGINSKDGESRKILQRVGEQMREHDPDVWVKYVLANMLHGDELVVVDDLRYINEAKAMKANGFTLIQVDTPLNTRLERVQSLYPDTEFLLASSHDSELEWEHIEPDFKISSVDIGALFKLGEIINAENSTYRKAPPRKRSSSTASGSRS